MENNIKALTLALTFKGVTMRELETLAKEINLGSVSLMIDSKFTFVLDISTYNPIVNENYSITFPLYYNADLEEKSKEIIELTLAKGFSEISGSVYLEETPTSITDEGDILVNLMYVGENTRVYELELE